MFSFGRRLRFIAIAWAFVQATLPAALVLGDAWLVAQNGQGPKSHVEAGSGSGCRPVHSADCVLCRFVADSFATLAKPADFLCAAWRVSPISPARAELRGVELPVLPPSRAPPTLDVHAHIPISVRAGRI